ncbi:MAG: hypothetical protein Q4A21_01400 [bacterium]|nr:hypothetical protein [bacterium]
MIEYVFILSLNAVRRLAKYLISENITEQYSENKIVFYGSGKKDTDFTITYTLGSRGVEVNLREKKRFGIYLLANIYFEIHSYAIRTSYDEDSYNYAPILHDELIYKVENFLKEEVDRAKKKYYSKTKLIEL